MSIFEILNEDLFTEADEDALDLDTAEGGEKTPTPEETEAEAPIEDTEEETKVEGDPKALVDAMIKFAPDQKNQIGVILKYAANSIPDYDIWDTALDYFESIEDEKEEAPAEEPTEEVPTEEPAPEGGEESPAEEGGGEELDLDF